MKFIYSILLLFCYSNVSAQFDVELDELYDGEIIIEGKEVKMFTIYTSFETDSIIKKISDDFGGYETFNKKNEIKIYKWSNILHKKWSEKPIDLYVESGHTGEFIKTKEGEMIYQKANPSLIIYGFDQNNEDILQSPKTTSGLKTYVEKQIRTTKRNQPKPIVVFDNPRNSFLELPNPYSRVILVHHSLENYAVINKCIETFGNHEVSQSEKTKHTIYKWKNQQNSKWFDKSFTLVVSIDSENRLVNAFSKLGGVYYEGKLIKNPKNIISVYLSDENNNTMVLTDEQTSQIMTDLKKIIQK